MLNDDEFYRRVEMIDGIKRVRNTDPLKSIAHPVYVRDFLDNSARNPGIFDLPVGYDSYLAVFNPMYIVRDLVKKTKLTTTEINRIRINQPNHGNGVSIR